MATGKNIIYITALSSVFFFTGCSSVKSGSTIPVTQTQDRAESVSQVHFDDTTFTQILIQLGANYSASERRKLKQQVHAQLHFLSVDKRTWFSKSLNRGQKYLPGIETELHKRKLPKKLAYLPLIESSYRVKALSHAQARGLWQFIPATAKRYGLHVSRYRDDRLDSKKATIAASRYLSDLQKKFKGDTLLALAGYNAGEGRVAKALKSQGDSFPDVSHRLPRETQKYVPRFIAAVMLASAPEKWALSPPYQGGHIVTLSSSKKIRDIARITQVPVSSIYRLNSELNGKTTTPKVRNYVIRLPRKPRPQQLAELANPNASTMTARTPKATQTLAITKTQSRQLSAKEQRSKKKKTRAMVIPRGKYVNYQVQPGNTLSQISQWFGKSIAQLKQWNPALKSNGQIKSGQQLKVYGLSRDWQKAKYQVKKGDSYWQISQRFNIPVSHLQGWNPYRPEQLRPGLQLVVYYQNRKTKHS